MYFVSLCGVAITMPLTIKLNGFFIVLTIVSAALCFMSHKNKIIFNTQIVLFLALYFGALVGVINSTNIKIAYFDLEQKLPWIFLPLVFLIGDKLTKKEFIVILQAFLISVCCLSGYALTTPESFLNQPSINLQSMTWFSWNESLPIDRIYLGMYCVFAFVIINYLFYLSARTLEKIIYTIVFLLLLVSLVNTFAKSAMIVLLLVCILELGYVLYKKGKIFFYAGVGMLVAVTIVLFMTNNPLRIVTKKILNTETFDFSNKPLLFESINFRYLTWGSSWTALKQNNNWITGVGTGDTQNLLNELYTQRLNEHERNYIAMGYNSHNQYFTTWLNFGLAFFLILVYQFLYSLHCYSRAGLRIGIYFILIVMGSCMTESMLETQKGIVFYTFFQLLLFSRVDNESSLVAGRV